MPALAILLSLDYAASIVTHKEDKKQFRLGDVVPFITGLLLGGDAATRTWFSLFIRNGQKVGTDNFSCVTKNIHRFFFSYFSVTNESLLCKHSEKLY